MTHSKKVTKVSLFPLFFQALFAIVLLSTFSIVLAESTLMEVYKNPQCGCCEQWVTKMRSAGFTVNVHNVNDTSAKRLELGMPKRYGSCHSAKIGDYLVEGHVPAADIKRMLKEKPKAIGIAAPGMPLGSPGMEVKGQKPRSYNTLLVTKDAQSTIYEKH